MATNLTSMRILVVGAGIAGLSAALALRARGADITLIDKVESSEGASISITNRGVDAGTAGFYVQPDGNMIVTSRLPGNQLYMATGREMEDRLVSQSEAIAILEDIFGQYSAPLIRGMRERLASNPPVLVRPFDWLMVPPPWHSGRILLIGDAAHSTTANLSSGGSMALEDGVVLAQEITAADDLDAALDNYVARRFPRTSLVVEVSVALTKLTASGADPKEIEALRARALTTLAEPY